MRALLIGTVSTTLVGCSCLVPPQSNLEPCLSRSCFGSSNRAPIELKPALFVPPPSPMTAKLRTAAKPTKPPSAQPANGSGQTDGHPHTPATATNEMPVSDQHSDTTDPVLTKAMATIAAKMGDPSSAQFDDMKRALRKNTLGQPIDTICGHVRGKKTSGEATGERPFLYLVKEDEAYVVDGNADADSAAAIAYRNICTTADARGKDLRQRQKPQ